MTVIASAQGRPNTGASDELLDRAWLERRLSERATVADLASDSGRPILVVRLALERHGLLLQSQKPAGSGNGDSGAAGDDPAADDELARVRALQATYPQLADPEWLRSRNHDDGIGLSGIAQQVGCSPRQAALAFTSHGIKPRQGRHGRRRHPLLDDAEWLRRRHHEEGASMKEIAAEIGRAHSTVLRALQRHGIERRWAYPILADRDWLETRYEVTQSTVSIAAEVGCTKSAVLRALHHHGIRIRPRRRPVHGQLADRKWLERRFVIEGVSVKAIAAELGRSTSAVYRALERLGIEDRQRPSLLSDQQWLEGRLASGASAKEIASEVGCHIQSVYRALARHGITSHRAR